MSCTYCKAFDNNISIQFSFFVRYRIRMKKMMEDEDELDVMNISQSSSDQFSLANISMRSIDG